MLWELYTFFLAGLNLCELLFLLSPKAFRFYQLFPRWSRPLWFVVLVALKVTRFYHLLLKFPDLCDSWKIFASVASLKVSRFLTAFFACQSLSAWLLIVLRTEILSPICSKVRVCSISSCFENLRPPWDFTTFFLAGRDLCIFRYFEGPLWLLETLAPFSSQMWDCTISDSFSSLRRLGDFTNVFLFCLHNCDFW